MRKFFCIKIYKRIRVFSKRKYDIYILLKCDIVYIGFISLNWFFIVITFLKQKGEAIVKFDDQRLLGVRLGSMLVTDENQYLVIKKKDHYALLNIHNLECTHVEVQLEHIEELLQEDFQESITEIIAPEHIKIVAKNVI